MSNHLVIGLGEIGRPIKDLLGADGFDTKDPSGNFESDPRYDFIHICFPYSATFTESVQGYQRVFKPKYTVIHSTVPVGTCEKLNAIHSPMRGKHPHMAEGLTTFVKFFGGPGARAAAKEFSARGIEVFVTSKSRNTEAMKLWDTTQYGWNIVLEKMIFDWCEANNVHFDLVYTIANETYNEGYEKLGYPEYKKYILEHIPGPMGGHCVVQNTDLLPSEAATFIANFNSRTPSVSVTE